MENHVLSAESIFTKWQQLCEAQPDLLKEVDGVFKLRVAGDGGGTWMLCCGENARIYAGDDEADCEIALSESDFVDLVSGNLNPQVAFFEGRICLAGNSQLALELDHVFQELIRG